ncbi:MobV family relaxase [Anabaena azotica]|uniref:MobV family relaxase n=1 Tax=Anabaena azotica TaxID=197653 RepID=UPI0039A42DAA
MVALAILRIAKLKSFGNLGASEAHTARLQETPNADPTQENIRLIGNADDPPLEEMVKAKIASATKHKPRKDAVLCSEIFLSASPEYFRPNDISKAGEWDEDLMWSFAHASTKWLQKNYADKCVRLELHLDEATPHIHAYVVPINDKTNQLSHKAMFGGDGRSASIKLSQLQDSYAEALAPLGISRGVKGSKANYTKVREYYQAVNSEPLSLELDRFAPQPRETAKQLLERIKADLAIETINHQLADRSRIIEQERRASQKAIASEKLRQQLEQRVLELETEISQLQQQVRQLSNLPLEDVAWHLGLDQDISSYRLWKGQEHIIDIDGSKWCDLSTNSQKTGDGAVALVKHINGCNFREAIAWLNDQFGEEGMQRAVTHYARQQAQNVVQDEPAPQFVPPVPDKSNWHLVHDYLTKKRRLPTELVQELYQRGLVYADNQQNTVFLLKNLNGETKGALLQGITEDNNTDFGYATGTKRNQGWFYLQWGGQPTDEIQKVVLLKSPLDVLSYAMLEVERHQGVPGGVPQQRIMYMTVDSPKSLPVELLHDIPDVVCAYNNDAAGDATARAVRELLPQATRMRPKAQDWHEEWLTRLRWQEKERQQPQQQQQRQQRELEL